MNAQESLGSPVAGFSLHLSALDKADDAVLDKLFTTCLSDLELVQV